MNRTKPSLLARLFGKKTVHSEEKAEQPTDEVAKQAGAPLADNAPSDDAPPTDNAPKTDASTPVGDSLDRPEPTPQPVEQPTEQPPESAEPIATAAVPAPAKQPESELTEGQRILEREVKRKKRRAKQWREIRSFFLNLILTVGAVWAIFTFVFGVYILDGEDMYPRMRDGDLVLFYRMVEDYVVDDVLTFTIDETRYTARYVAMAGDVVEVTADGFLLINGAIQSEEIFYGTYPMESDITYPYTVPDGCVFVLGDFRTLATDSRLFGAISLEDIDGKVITLLRRRVI